MTTKATYTKLKSGNWGVRVEGEVKPGESVTVTKKSGDTKTETISFAPVRMTYAQWGALCDALGCTPEATIADVIRKAERMAELLVETRRAYDRLEKRRAERGASGDRQ